MYFFYFSSETLLGVLMLACMSIIQADENNNEFLIQNYIDSVITDFYLPLSNISKLGLAVVKDGKLLYSTGYGLANEEKGIPNGNDTQFLIASTTKSISAVLIAKTLHERFPEVDELVLDTPIRKLIPQYNFTMIDRFRSVSGTFRDLLSHRMCILRDDYQFIAEAFSNKSEIVFRQRYAQEDCGFRSEFQYNNIMYLYAAELMETLTNKTFDVLMQGFLMELGMTNTQLIKKTDDFDAIINRAKPYYILGGKRLPYNINLIKRVVDYSPAGGLFSSTNDMSRFMMFHLNKGKLDGKVIVPENVMNWLIKASSPISSTYYPGLPPQTKVFNYGLGMFLGTYSGWDHIQHAGYFPPYRSLMSLFPEHNIGIFTSSSEGPVLLSQFSLQTFLFDTVFGKLNISNQPKPNWAKFVENTFEKTNKKEKVMSLHIKKVQDVYKHESPFDIIGQYGSGCSGSASVSARFNNQLNSIGLYVSYGKWAKGWLENVGGSIYKVFWSTDIVQDNYQGGDSRNYGYVRIENRTLEFIALDQDDNVYPLSSFKKGLRFEDFPTIPWSPNSCGYEKPN